MENRRDLNERLGDRLEDELREYFLARNEEPNKRGWRKLGWWADVANDVALTDVSDSGATVTVANGAFALRQRGDVIRPVEAGSLTIPNVEEAYGKSVAEYEQETGRKLFRPAGARYLAYGDGESVTLVYFLTQQVTITADPHALPPVADLTAALNEEVEVYLEGVLS
ncbi:hypothetical protein [Rubritalea sp.]|uniref:hypothetical protein n=1 Tax=Rubritalea sp. TaxID=2109375 RepID=UPI003EF8F375